MARQFKIFGQEILIGKRLFGIGKDDDIGFFAQSLDGADTKSFKRLKQYYGLVYACINRIAETYATYDPYIEEKNGNEWKVLDDHAFLRLLRNPSGMDNKAVPISQFDILYATAALIKLQDEVYWYMPRGRLTGQPKEIIILRGDRVRQRYNETGDIIGYYVLQGAKAKEQAIPKSIQTDDFTNKFTKNFFANNAGISGVLSFKGQMEKGAFKKAVRAWREKYQGVDNAGKVMMVRESDANFIKVGLGLDELDMSALRDMSREDIAIMYGVPLPLLGKGDQNGLGRANIEALEYIFAKYTINPMMVRLDNILQFAIDRYYATPESKPIRIKHNNIIPEDKEFELRARELGVDKWLTRNEVRAQDNNDDVPGGDQLFIPFSNVPINEASLDTGSGSASTQNSLKGGLKIKVTKKISTSEVSQSKKKESSEPDHSVAKENFRLRLMRNQIAYERRYTRQVKPIISAQRKEALNNLEAHGASFAKGSTIESRTKAVQDLFDIVNARSEMEKALVPTLVSLGEDQGALALLFAGDEDSEFRLTAPYEKLIRNSTRRMADRFNNDTLDRLNNTLAEGIRQGESLGDLKNRVSTVYDYTENFRAARVARTETLKASNNATEEAYKQTGFVNAKEWYVNPDACPICEEFNGKTIGLDETFVKVGQTYSYTDANGDEQTIENTYDDVDNPPLHPNCRCTIIPIR